MNKKSAYFGRSPLSAMLIVLTVLSGAGSPSGVQAQEPDETFWRFAYNEASVIAYTLDGTVNVLQTGEYGIPGSYCTQIGPETALFRVDEQPGLQRLTPDTIEPMIPAPGVDEITLMLILGTSPARNYVVSGPPPSEEGTVFLMNLETRLVEPLSGQVNRTQVRFSADEHFLRYVSRTDVGDELRERELATGAERVIYSGILDPVDRYGEYWLGQEWDREARTTTYRLISVAGSVEEIAVFRRDNLDYPDEAGLLIQTLDGVLVTYDTSFGADFRFVVQPLDGGAPVTFTGPETAEEDRAAPLKYIDESHLLVQLTGPESNTPDIWLLGSDGTAKAIGFSFGPRDMRSFPSLPNTRWYVVSDTVVDSSQQTGKHYLVWDSVTFEYVLAGTFDMMVFFTFGETGFMVDDTRTSLFYRAADGEVFRMPEQLRGMFDTSRFLPGDTILYEQLPTYQTGMEPGLYRYDPAAETYTLMAAGEGWFPCSVFPG